MIVATVWHGRDAYDHTIPPMLHQTYKNMDEPMLQNLISQHDKHVKMGAIPWYLISIVRFDVGGQPIAEAYHRATPLKTKILLNPKAKAEPKTKKTLGHDGAMANLWAHINDMPVAPPAFVNGPAGVVVPAQPNENW